MSMYKYIIKEVLYFPSLKVNVYNLILILTFIWVKGVIWQDNILQYLMSGKCHIIQIVFLSNKWQKYNWWYIFSKRLPTSKYWLVFYDMHTITVINKSILTGFLWYAHNYNV